MAIGLNMGDRDEIEDDGPIGISPSMKEDCRNQGDSMRISEDKKSEILQGLKIKRDMLTSQLEVLKKKVKTDEEYLVDFPMPPRITNIRQTETIFYNPEIRELKNFLNNLEEKEYCKYSLVADYDGDVRLEKDTFREEGNGEYEARVYKLKNQHVVAKRQVFEQDLGKNIKGLEKNIKGLTNTINKMEPPPTPEERFKELTKSLDPKDQEELLTISYRLFRQH